MRRITMALLASLTLALAACGGGGDLTSDTPRTVPDLTVPTAPASEGSGTSTGESTSTTSTSTTPAESAGAGGSAETGGSTPDTSGGQAAPAQPDTTTQQGQAGGQAAPSQGGTPTQPEATGGAQAGGASADFCANNPGAC
jgi:hypothetical protein